MISWPPLASADTRPWGNQLFEPGEKRHGATPDGRSNVGGWGSNANLVVLDFFVPTIIGEVDGPSPERPLVFPLRLYWRRSPDISPSAGRADKNRKKIAASQEYGTQGFFVE
jgi:hypothetical protein